MKTFQEFQEQILSSVERDQINMAGLKSAARQRANYATWQRKHAYHEIESKSARENRERMNRQERIKQCR